MPGTAVNKHGDAIYVYGRTGIVTAAPLFPEVRYSVWAHGESSPRRSVLLRADDYQPQWFYDADTTDSAPAETTKTSITHAFLKVDYATAVVDPVDDETFWTIHEYVDNDDTSHDIQYWSAVVGHISATLP